MGEKKQREGIVNNCFYVRVFTSKNILAYNNRVLMLVPHCHQAKKFIVLQNEKMT